MDDSLCRRHYPKGPRGDTIATHDRPGLSHLNDDSRESCKSRRSRLTGSLADRLELTIPIIGFLIVIAFGISTSSLGVPELRQNPRHTDATIVGVPREIRSDEWLTQAPLELNVLALGHSTHSPLSGGPDIVFQVSSGQFFESLFFFESTILRLGPLLPDAQLFAAMRALPVLLVLLTFPPLLRRFGASRPQSWLAVALLLLAPSSLWWSFTPVRILSFASTGGYLLAAARDRLASGRRRSRGVAVVQALVGGVLVAQLATYYVPWGLTIGLPIVLATAAWLSWSVPRRPGLVVLALGSLAGGLLLGLTLWENLPTVKATLETVYPGTRRATGSPVEPFQLFGAPALFKSSIDVAAASPNASEITSGFLICAVWGVLILSRPRPRLTDGQRAAQSTLALSLLVLVAWCTLSWGRLGLQIPLLNVVPPGRAAQTAGYVAAAWCCLALSGMHTSAWRKALVVAVVCGLVTAWGLADLRHALTTVDTIDIWMTSVVVGLLIAVVTRYPARAAPVIVVCVALIWSGYRVNPLMFGLGDIRVSAAAHSARHLGDRARAQDRWIAAESPFVSALLVANGAPSITGSQVSGPDRKAWRTLDPTGRYESRWNRGASYLRMTFIDSPGSPAVVDNPNPDVIQVTVDPCVLADTTLKVGYVVSAHRLAAGCLVREGSIRWSGQRNFVYEVISTPH